MFIPGETFTLLSASLLCLVEQFRFLLQDRLHLCRHCLSPPMQNHDFSSEFNNLDDSTQLRMSPSQQGAEESHQYLNRTGQPSKAYPFSPTISVCADFRRKSKGFSWSLQSCNWDLQPTHKTIMSTPNYQYTAVFCVWSPLL